jgi:Protein of unknown function (DUF2795)
MVDKSTLDACLKDISFPAAVHTIVECAEGNSCPRDVLSQVQAMPSRTFSSEEELLCRLGNSDYCYVS